MECSLLGRLNALEEREEINTRRIHCIEGILQIHPDKINLVNLLSHKIKEVEKHINTMLKVGMDTLKYRIEVIENKIKLYDIIPKNKESIVDGYYLQPGLNCQQKLKAYTDNIILKHNITNYNPILQTIDSCFNEYINYDKTHEKWFETISKWIGKPKNYKLIYTASKGGFTAKSFHYFCDGKAPTVTIIHTQKTNKYIGGYTIIPWTTYGKSIDPTKSGFLFSLTLNKKYKKTAIDWELYGSIYNGPTFGGNNNLKIDDRCNENEAENYAYNTNGLFYEAETFDQFTGGFTQRFEVLEYEVFEVFNT
jgi:hypothetical protein